MLSPALPSATASHSDGHDAVKREVVFSKMDTPALRDYWLLQIVLQTLSKATEVPLRAACLSPAHEFHLTPSDATPGLDYLCASDGGKHRLPVPTGDWLDSATHYKTFPTEWEAIYHSLSPRLWLTDSYNAYPIVIAFREHRSWRMLSLVYTIGALLRMDQSKEDICSADYFSHFHISIHHVHLPDVVIIAGPVWAPLERHSGSHFHTNREKPAVDHFKLAMERSGDSIRYGDERLRRLAASRWPVAHHDLAQRMKVITLTINSLADMLCTDGLSLRQCDLVGLIEWAVFCVQLSIESVDNRFPGALTQTAFRVDHSTADITAPESVLITTGLAQSGLTSDSYPVFGLSNTTRFDGDGHSSRLIMINDNESAHSNADASDLENIRNRFTRFLGSLRVQDNAFKMESLFLMREWLTEQMGVLTALSIVVQNDIERVKEVSHKLARRTLQLLSADLATIYCYDYQHDTLATYGAYRPWQKRWSTTSPHSMTDALALDTRLGSLSYRAFDTSDTRFCRAYDPLIGTCDPPGEPLSPVSAYVSAGRSGIACPISIFERPWGILEVVGLRPYQFRWYDKCFMEEIAALLSPFYYNFSFLKHFHALNVVAVGRYAIEEKYKAIARHVAGLFLSESAVLWIKESSASGVLQLASWCNRPDLDEMAVSQDAFGARLQHQEPTAITQQIIARGQVWQQGIIGEAPLWKEWLRKPYTEKLESHGFRTAAFIPIQKESGECVASVTLYSKSQKRWSNDWEPLVRFTKRYLAVLLDAVHSRADWERTARNSITHNLQEYVYIMKAASENIASYVEALGFGDACRNSIDDIRSSAKDCDREIEALSSENLAEVERIGGDAQIELSRKALRSEPLQWNNFKYNFNKVFRPNWKGQQERRLKIVYGRHADGPLIRMHEFSLREVLSALYSNAIKYAPAGTSIVTGWREGTYATYFYVKNLGEALEDGERYRIFRKGVRGLKPEKKGVEGQGLGLYVARAICEMYSAALDYKSHTAPSAGLVWHEFYITFPKALLRLD